MKGFFKTQSGNDGIGFPRQHKTDAAGFGEGNLHDIAFGKRTIVGADILTEGFFLAAKVLAQSLLKIVLDPVGQWAQGNGHVGVVHPKEGGGFAFDHRLGADWFLFQIKGAEINLEAHGPPEGRPVKGDFFAVHHHRIGDLHALDLNRVKGICGEKNQNENDLYGKKTIHWTSLAKLYFALILFTMKFFHPVWHRSAIIWAVFFSVSFQALLASEETNRLAFRLVPRIGYSPETSWRLGLLGRLSGYQGTDPRYVWALSMDASGSTLPSLAPNLELDLARLKGFGGDWRLLTSFRFRYLPNETFAGFGNSDASTGSAFALRPSDSTYRKTQVRFQSTAFLPLVTFGGSLQPRLQLAIGLNGEGADFGESDTNRSLGRSGRLFGISPHGSAGGFWTGLRAGLLLEGRDVPAYARKGFMQEIWWEENVGTLGALTESRRLTISHKHYLPLLPRLVWAQRLVFDWLSGDWPFFLAERTGGEKELTAFGGGESIRGLAPFRFQGPVKLFSSTELRWHLWFLNLHFLKSDWQWEVVAFADLGRVWTSIEPFWGDDWHLGYGGGVRLLWGRDFVISLDFAVYRERFGGVYFGVAQAF